MNRRALSPVLVAAAMLAPTRALAQLETPKMPAPLPVETTALLWVKWEDVQVRYARAGTKPLQYRLGRDPTFESAPWQSFQEGATGSFVATGIRWITGTVPINTNFHMATPSTSCPPNHVRYRVFLQFRIRNATMQMINGPIRADSTACIGVAD